MQEGLFLDNSENTSKTPRTGDGPIFYEAIPLDTSLQPGPKVENEDTGAYSSSPVSSFGRYVVPGMINAHLFTDC